MSKTQPPSVPNALGKKIGAAIIGATLLLAIFIIELVLGGDKHPGNSFSQILRGWAITGLAAPLSWGILAGHFFHPVAKLQPLLVKLCNISGNVNLIVAIAPILLFIIIDVIVAVAVPEHTYGGWVPSMMLGIGCLYGTIFWPVTGYTQFDSI